MQDIAGSVNPGATVTTKTNGGYSSLTLALKAASAGTAPTPALRIVGVYHTRYVINGVTGTATYPLQFPTMGNLQCIALSDPKSTVGVSAMSGAFSGTWTTYTPDAGCPTMAYVTNSTPSGDEMLAYTVNNPTSSSYNQGILYDVIHAGQFDTSAFLPSGAAFGPGNSGNAPSITPGVSAGIVIDVTELDIGPPDSLVSPAGLFMSTNYTNETDTSFMDNGDCHGVYVYSSNATQNWSYHDTAATAGYNAVAISFTAAPIITAQPTNQYASPGGSVSFSVTATASGGSVTYQWYRNGSLITGATSATYTFTPNYPADYAATWHCMLTDSNGNRNSSLVQVIWRLEIFGNGRRLSRMMARRITFPN